MSDIALITTTIGKADVLRAYRDDDADVHIIVAGDLRSPHDDLTALCQELGNARYLSPDEQDAAYPTLSDFIGWRCVQRRNLAILEAIREGADVIYTMDDDIAPDDFGFFAGVRARLGRRDAYTGVTHGNWMNPGNWARPGWYAARGFPWQLRRDTIGMIHGMATVTVGAFHCLHLGDPDTDAVDNIVNAPEVEHYRLPFGATEVVVNPAVTFAPLNTGATAYRREVAPLLFVIPGIGRYDDIWAGYIAERVMGAQGWWLGYGAPFTRHTRNAHNLMTDLKAEMFGMEHTLDFCQVLREISVSPTGDALEGLQDVAEGLRGDDSRWQAVVDFLDVWVEAVAGVWRGQ